MDFTRTFSLTASLNFLLALVLYLAANQHVYAINNIDSELEREYHHVTARFYTALAKSHAPCRTQATTFKALVSKIKDLTQRNKQVTAICLLQHHQSLLKDNIDSKEMFVIFKLLLDNNYLKLADQLYIYAKNETDKSLISNISFIFSQYYVEQQNWEKVLQHTKGTYLDLTFENGNLAKLYTGTALQKLKKHREAVKIYLKIPAHSKYYPAARLNIATAYIRQDWWTDAQININEVLHSRKLKTDDEMINRLYLVLGYSLLNKEFYRDAREAFRNIEITSTYFNKALLGIALTATNQQDYVGALNAVNILRKRTPVDLSVEESHLLLPYIYEKLGQSMTAHASYTDALNYYQQRINEVKVSSNKKRQALKPAAILPRDGDITINTTVYSTKQTFNSTFLKELVQLEKYRAYLPRIKNQQLTNRVKRLQKKYNSQFLIKSRKLYDTRITYLNNYMNQSRFGLARLFDNSTASLN